MRSSKQPITIVGGGLAGLTLGIALRRCDVPVNLFEAAGYPRHRVCGEFICGSGLDTLRRLGLFDRLVTAGACEASHASFHRANHSYRAKSLPRPALCLSRHRMDQVLADEFRRLGGTLHERQRISAATPRPGFVRATGRRMAPDLSGIRWIGLKAHARAAALDADLEMHFVPGGYIGLCRLGNDLTNVCGLFAVPGPIPRLAERWADFLRGPAGSILHQRLAGAEFVADSFCAVAALDLRPPARDETPDCRVGDAWSMIPPVTGNGMSMAFESAACAAPPLAAYSCGTISWDRARMEVESNCRRRFGRRLRWAGWLQWLLMQPGSRAFMLALADRSDWVWRAFFHRTR
jgi:menaquinone-9 beta-reductase